MASREWSVSEIESAVREAFGRLGYPDVRDEQLEAAREFLRGQDVFVSLPTGSGKSFCYGCLPLAFKTEHSGYCDGRIAGYALCWLAAWTGRCNRDAGAASRPLSRTWR